MTHYIIPHIVTKAKQPRPTHKSQGKAFHSFALSLFPMFSRSFSSRRILTFPAVHPCEDICPATLLDSLINLAKSVCAYKSSKFFACNKPNACKTIRQVEVLLLFLEEVQHGLSLEFPDSLVLSFSELHLALQKLRFLLEDCTREGARLWMLMNCERVAMQFHGFGCAVATALDVLPLRVLDVSSEGKDLVEFLKRQARKVRYEVDRCEDMKVMKDVLMVLSGFEDGVEPEVRVLRMVLDYLGIHSWSECNKEVKFLDFEIELESLNAADKRLNYELLSSLMGFMSYCNCVVFDIVDTNEVCQQHEARDTGSVLKRLNSNDFRCPISLEFMADPVTISSGHTYDRASILKWFKARNFTCPKTGEKLNSKELVPNHAVRRLIRQYCSEKAILIADSVHKNRDIARTILPGSLAAGEAMKLLAGFLVRKLKDGTFQEKNKAAYEIRILSKTSLFNRSCLVESGAISHLLMLLSSSDSTAQENAVTSLLNLSKHSKSRAMIVESGGLYLIADVLKKGLKQETQHHAAATLFYIACVDEYRELIGQIPEVFPALIELIKVGSERGKKHALVAIFGLLMHPGNHWRVLAAGAVPLLINLIIQSCEIEDIVTDALAILACLAEKPDGSVAILRRRQALPLVVAILGSSSISRAGKEHCASLLLALCTNGGKAVVGLLVKSPTLMGSLYSLLSEGTSRASKKGSALIKLLHEFYERSSSSGSANAVVLQERSVPVW